MAGFSTAHSLGAGYQIMLDSCDYLYLFTESGRTELVLVYDSSAGEIDELGFGEV